MKLSIADIDKYVTAGRSKELADSFESNSMKQLIEFRRRFLAIKHKGKLEAASSGRRSDGVCSLPISVIVPVYNTSAYIGKCLDSILAQSFRDFEVICIDDCSTDDSWTLLQSYAKKDARILICRHEANKGLGGARNTAIRMAKGKYLASVDSDDYVAPNMLEILYGAAEAEQACVVVCGFNRVGSDGRNLKTQRYSSKHVVNQNNSLDIFSTCNPAFWNKLWRRDLFVANDIYFPDYVFYQDLATTPRILARAKKVSFVPDCPYYYLIREGSATYSHTPKHITDYYTVFGVLREFLHENGLYERYEAEFNVALRRACKFRGENILSSSLTDDEKRQHLAYVLSIYHYFNSVAPVSDHFEPEQYLSALNSSASELVASRPDALPLAVIVKTICRPDLLERFLESVGRYQRITGQRFTEVLVGDDSPLDEQQLNASAVERIRSLYPDLNIKYLRFEYDVGCSAGRNRLVQAASTPFILQCDDDFLLDEVCNIGDALALIKRKGVDIIGGWLKNKFDVTTGEYEYRAALGYFSVSDNVLKLVVNENKYDIPDYSECDFIMNFFIAKKSALLENPWDEDLKTEEHHEFFYRAYRNRLKVGFTKRLFAKHTYEKLNNSAAYNAHRFDKQRWCHYLFSSLSKCDVNKRLIETRKWDRAVVWEVDRIEQVSREKILPYDKTA